MDAPEENLRNIMFHVERALEMLGCRAENDGTGRPADALYRSLTLLGALALLRRMQISTMITLSPQDKIMVASSAYAIISPHQDIHREVASQRVHEALCLLEVDLLTSGDESLPGVISTLLAAAGFLLTSMQLPDPMGTPVMHNGEPIIVPDAATLVAESRQRIRAALEQLGKLAP
jgi:hypothetical protein